MATLNVKDALSYLDQVKVQFAEHPDVYNRFLDIMKDFKSQTIDTPGVIERVSTLFRGHPSLIQGFNTFLPPGYRIECSLDPSESNLITVTTPTGTTTQTSGGVGIAGAISRMQHSGSGSASSAAAGSGGASGAGNASTGSQRERGTPAPSGAPPPPHTPGGSSYGGGAGVSAGTAGHAPALPPGTMASLGTPQRQPHSPALGGPATPGATAGAGVLSHASFGSSGAASGPAAQQAGDRRAPVEFNHAISYVNRIKQRFSNDPDTYKQFLEILQTYQKEQRPIGDVYAQVTTLFNNDKDLLDEFKQFLPDTSAGAPPSGGSLFGMLGHASTGANQAGVAAPTASAMGPSHVGAQIHGMHGMMQGIAPPGSAATGRHDGGVPPDLNKKAGSGSRSKKRAGGGGGVSGQGATGSEQAATGRGSKSKKSKHGHAGAKVEGHSPPRDMLPPDAAAAAAYSNAHLMHHQPPPHALVYSIDGSLVPAAGLGAGMGMGADASLVPVGLGAGAAGYGLGAGAVAAPLATTDEVAFFDRVKKLIDDRAVYLEFLKLLNLYTQDIIDIRTLVDRASLFIGGDRELFDAFQRLCGYDMGKHGWLEAEDPIIENVPALQRERVDLSNCKTYGASYRKLPKSEINLACSGRDPMCWEVLNDVWVSHPTWASEGESFNPHKKNVYEDALYRSEEERHEYDYHIEANLRTIALLEPIAARIQTMDAEERAAFRLKPGLGGQSKSIYQRVIKKVYGREHGVEVIAALHDNPCVAVPVVLARLKQKDEEWKRAQREWNKVWREVDARNYYKSLDHQGVNFKVSDKKTITSKAFVAEIESRRAQQQQRRVTIDATLPRPRPDHQLAFAMDDMVVLTDIIKLSLSFLDRAPYSKGDCDRIEHLLRTFIPLLMCLDQNEFDDEINGGVAVDGRDAAGADDDAESRIDDDARSEVSDADSAAASGASSTVKRGGSSKRHEADLRRKLLRNQAETSGAAQAGADAEPIAARASSPAIAAEVKAAAEALDSATTPVVAGANAEPQDVSMTDASDDVAEASTDKTGDAKSEQGVISKEGQARDDAGDISSDGPSTWMDQGSLQAYDSSKAKTVPAPGSSHIAKAVASGNDKGASSRKYNFFCSTSHYVFIRLFQLLYARLSRMKQLGEQMASAQPPKKRLNPVALELGLQDPTTGPASVVGNAAASAAVNRGNESTAAAVNGNGVVSDGPNGVSAAVEEDGLSLSPLRYYDTLLDLTEKFFDAELDRVTFEESVRYMYGIEGYVVFTLDKVIGSLVKTAQVLATDSKCQELQSILERDRAVGAAADMKAQIARRIAAEEVLGKDEHLFRMEWIKTSSTLLVQMLAKEDLTLGDPQTAEERWLQYVSSYVLHAPTEGLSVRVQAPFLDRSVGAHPEDRSEPAGAKVIAQSGLGIKICITTLRLFYDDRGYEDVFARRLQRPQLARRDKVAKKQRGARKTKLDSWISDRLAAISEGSADSASKQGQDVANATVAEDASNGMDIDATAAPEQTAKQDQEAVAPTAVTSAS